jgi:hypothetical protein
MGLLYDVAFPALIVFSIVAELAAIPLLIRVMPRTLQTPTRPGAS